MNQETVIFKMSKELKEQLMEEARSKGLSMSAYIRTILINRKSK